MPKTYYEAHREERKAYQKTYNESHREERKAYRTAYRKARLVTDLNFKLAAYLRTRMSIAVRNGQKSGSAVSDLGCTIPEFKAYIERQFRLGMSWDNYGKWHLDHIRPLAHFDLADRKQFLQVAHYTNYQPLWGFENLSKGNR